MLPILLLLDPDSLLALGKCSRRLFRLVCDQEVWSHLVRSHLALLEPPGAPDRRIPEFHLERLKDLGEFAAKSATRQDMTAEVLKQRASQLDNRLCGNRVGCRKMQLTFSINTWGNPGTYKIFSCQVFPFMDLVGALGSSPFNIVELLCQNRVSSGPLHLVEEHVAGQEENLVKLRIELWGLMDVFHKVSGDDDELFSLLKKSQRWEVGKLFFDQASYWPTLASFASTGDIVRLDFDNHLGELEKVKKEDARKIWEISGGIRVLNPAVGVWEEFERLGKGVWSLEGGYKRARGPQEGFDPEVNWHRLVTFAGWESQGEPS